MVSVASQDSATRQAALSCALRQALHSSDRFLEWLPIGVAVCDAEGYLVQYNSRAAELWGQSPLSATESNASPAHIEPIDQTASRFPLNKRPWPNCFRPATRSVTVS
jgi:PAS domain-containing protein